MKYWIHIIWMVEYLLFCKYNYRESLLSNSYNKVVGSACVTIGHKYKSQIWNFTWNSLWKWNIPGKIYLVFI